MMNITALSATASSLAPASPTSTNAPASDPEVEFPFLTSDDIATLERATGTSSFAQLEQVDLSQVQHFNTSRQDGFLTDALALHLPTAFLTASDISLLEKTTGTTSLTDALRISTDASELADAIGWARQDGALVGNVSTSYLDNTLTASTQLEKLGSYGHLPSSAFIENAIENLQQTKDASSESAVSATA